MNNRKMKKKRLKKFISILNSKLVIGALIFIMLSLAIVFAGNVVVKEGSLTVDDNFNVNNLFFIKKFDALTG